MNRLDFTKSIELPLIEGVIKEKYPELLAIYNLIEHDNFMVKGHLLDENISFTVFCNKEDAVKISNRVQNHVMELCNTSITVSYNIHKEGIDLTFCR